MSLALSPLITAAERIDWPDGMLRAGVQFLVGRTRRALADAPVSEDVYFARKMADFPVALHADAANAQHYEVPPAFFEIVLGPHRKYSCCHFAPGVSDLGAAEADALARTCRTAGLTDGQNILELGCGWGSLSLYMAGHFPKSTITAVSNSRPQRETIEKLARVRGLTNLNIITADMNVFEAPQRYDRIVSVEMFEHMANWRALLEKCRAWLEPGGRMFMHVFTHSHASYRFDHTDRADWIAQHFFTGGIMPSQQLIRHFDDLFIVEHEERWSGEHYAKTARAWLDRFDANRDRIFTILEPVYGADTKLWMRRWRLFFLATEGLFGHAGGTVWGIGHYRLKRA